MSKKRTEPPAIEPGLHLVMGDLGQVVRSAPILNAPRRFVQPPFLTARTLKQITVPTSELVLDVLRSDGRRLDSFGWPWTAEAFYDRPLGEVLRGMVAYETIRVGRLEYLQPLRVLRVPVSQAAIFLLFSQSLALSGNDTRGLVMNRIGLTLYSLDSTITRAPRLPIPGVELPPRPLPGPAPLVKPR